MKVKKDEISQFAPWEQEEKEKKRPEKKGSIPAQTSQKSRVRSKPKSRDQDYLEMYTMAREKERLEKYGKTLGRRQKAIAATWKEVKAIMHDKQSNLPQVDKEGIEEIVDSEKEKKTKKKEKISGNMKKMDWEY